MSRPMLYATLCVLIAVLFGTSYALRKQTNPPKPEEPSPEQQAAKQKEMMAQQKKQMATEDTKRAEQEKRNTARQNEEKKNLEGAAKANPKVKINTKKTSGVDISDKWFKETPDGPAGIDQAIKEKEALDKFNASQPVPPATKTPPPARMAPVMPSK